MPKIFISYRRDDAAYPAHSIYDKLVAQFGRDSVVFDVDNIPLGIDFREYLNDAVGRSDLLLAVIGGRWLELRGADGRPRLHQASDFVRIEIQTALKRKTPVIPVLVGRALMPSKDDLPRGLVNFCNRLSKQEELTPCYAIDGEQVSRIDGTGYRLPSEAEWEYACRAGTTTRWTFGEDPSELGRYAWYDENSDNKMHPVGEKELNRWGVYDAHGNAWEWCCDRYADDYYKTSPNSDPIGPSSGDCRVLRGGTFLSDADDLRSANRYCVQPDFDWYAIGFRVARTYA